MNGLTDLLKDNHKYMNNIDKELRAATAESDRERMSQVKKAILKGKIYADIKSVSRSGMSRRIAFYMVDKNKEGNYIRRVTREIAWLTGWVPFQEYKQGGKYLVDDGLKVTGCGMDMIFHTLYSALSNDEAKNWNQRYSTL